MEYGLHKWASRLHANPAQFLPFVHATSISQFPKFKTSESASPFLSHFLSPVASNSSFYLKSSTSTQHHGLVQALSIDHPHTFIILRAPSLSPVSTCPPTSPEVASPNRYFMVPTLLKRFPLLSDRMHTYEHSQKILYSLTSTHISTSFPHPSL